MAKTGWVLFENRWGWEQGPCPDFQKEPILPTHTLFLKVKIENSTPYSSLQPSTCPQFETASATTAGVKPPVRKIANPPFYKVPIENSRRGSILTDGRKNAHGYVFSVRERRYLRTPTINRNMTSIQYQEVAYTIKRTIR